jgi:hypothetical protein
MNESVGCCLRARNDGEERVGELSAKPASRSTVVEDEATLAVSFEAPRAKGVGDLSLSFCLVHTTLV